MTDIHLEGFGWLGSVLAFRLDALGLDFTWSDVDAARTAWRASNGVIYPDGDAAAQRDAAAWSRWYRDGLVPRDLMAPALFAYSQKSPPHGGTYDPIRLWGSIHSSPPGRAYIVNVPAVVLRARETYAGRRREAAPDGALRVVSHGYGSRLARTEWGWTARARLRLPSAAQRALDEVGGIQLYGRVHRFALAYATSVPGTGEFMIGTSRLNSGRSNRALAAEHLLERVAQLERLFPGVRVRDMDAPVEGWRPIARKGDTFAAEARGSAVVLPSTGHSGVRRAPTVIESALTAIREATR